MVVERNNRNEVVMVERKQKCGGEEKTTEKWSWWYIVSLLTKLKNIVECRVDVGSI